MARKLFNVGIGLQDERIAYLSGSGVPGADASYEDAAGVGSRYSNTDNGDSYIKILAGSGTDRWTKEALFSDISDLTSSQSWREPVNAWDNTHADTTAAKADMDADDTFDGVAVFDGMRVLLNAVTGNNNIFIVSGSTGAWTLTEDPNAETAGDAVNVIGGSQSGKQFTYNGTQWIWTGQNTSDEEGFIRTFIGKNAAGSETPTYSSTNYVTDGTSLETAIGALDAQVGTNATDISDIQAELDRTQTALGTSVNDNGDYVAHTGTNYLDSNTSVTEDITDLDAAVKTNSDNIGNVADYSSNNVVVDGEDLATSVGKLDAALAASVTPSSADAVTTQVVLDSVGVDSVQTAKWLISATDASGNREAIELYAMHDGYGANDATQADFASYAKLKFGSVTGYTLDVDVSGTGATQVMRLLVSSTSAVDVRATRLTTAI